MTKPEAIKVLGELLDAYDRCEHGDYFYDYGQEVCEAITLAHGALSRSERETPVPIRVNDWRIYCPSCGKQQKSGKAAPWYCERCGQKLRSENGW